MENLRFCLGIDANNKCNAFYDVPTTPNAPAAAPAIDLSAYSLTFAPADIGVAKPITVTNVGTAPLVVTGGDDERPFAVHGHQRLHDAWRHRPPAPPS